MADDKPKGIPLRVRPDVETPSFCNLVLSTNFEVEEDSMVTLSFLHVYPVPTGVIDSEPQGDVTNRVTMSLTTAKKLRDLLVRQNPLTPPELKRLTKSPKKAQPK